MLKKLSGTTKLFGGLVLLVFIVMIIMIVIHGNETSRPSAHYSNDNASADNKVEALKTLTADLLAVENKNKALTQQVAALSRQNRQSALALKHSVTTQMQQALQTIARHNQQKQHALLDALHQQQKMHATDYPVRTPHPQPAFMWVSDVSRSHTANAMNDNALQLAPGDHQGTPHHKKKTTVRPVYTIPVNATLTGATLMTPLVGRVPIEGKLPAPYHFKLVLSADNLTANGYPLPGVKGAVLSGIASGDMLAHCARGAIHSITFIFNDGTISTTEAKGDNAALGYISSQTGNPCIAGSFHSDAVIFLGAQMGLAGAEGYANALASSQYLHAMTPEGGSISTLIGSANKAALGHGLSSAAQAAQTWWNRRVQNSFDYVYVPNVDPTTGHAMHVVVNITHPIAINYDPTARKVSYDTSLQNAYRELD